MSKSTYAGSVKNTGSQVVKAPSQHTEPKHNSRKTGKDLRSGKK